MTKYNRVFLQKSLHSVLTLLAIWLSTFGVETFAQPLAQKYYAEFSDDIYRIDVVTKGSGSKSSLGTGFVVADGRTLATNFHVIASAVYDPDLYQLEWESVNGRRGPASVLAVDVVHDLALVKTEEVMGAPMSTAPLPEKGSALFSLGHPLGLELAIVVGTANGLLEKSIYEKIHFSGNINPGMSGGPTVNEDGKVVGVNVASAGEAVGFLVPARFLDTLLERVQSITSAGSEAIMTDIGRQLFENQQQLFDELYNGDWKTHKVGKFLVPNQLSPRLDCWGDNQLEDDQTKFNEIGSNCMSQDSIYLSRRQRAGTVSYQYFWIESEQLSPRSFYFYYEQRNQSTFTDGGGEEDVGNFQCSIDFVTVAEQTFKANVCARPYINHPNLVDFMVLMAMTGHDNQGFLYTLDLSTITLQNAMDLYQRFLENFSWQP